MAYIYDPNLEDKEKQQAMQGGPAAPAPSTAAPTGGSVAAPAKPQGSGNFTNLQSYIRANQDTDAGKQVGTGVLNSADDELDSAGKSFQGLESISAGQGPAAMQKEDEDWLSSRSAPSQAAAAPGTGPFGNTGGIAGVTGSKAAAETAMTQANQNLDRFNSIFTKYGQGPGSYSGASKDDVAKQQAGTLSALNTATQASANLKGDNQQGRSQLLRSQYGQNRDYSQGENKLDSFLLERNYGDKFDPKFQQQQTQIKDQSGRLDGLAASKTKAIDDTQNAFTTAQERWRTLLNGAQTSVNTERDQAQAALTQAEQAEAAQQAQAAKDAMVGTNQQFVSANADRILDSLAGEMGSGTWRDQAESGVFDAVATWQQQNPGQPMTDEVLTALIRQLATG
jgi:hypothetical protein